MPTSAVKKLHLAKSMKDLEDQAKLTVDNKSTKLFVSSANRLFQAAESSYLDKDEEQAYIFYSRFVELVLKLKERNDFNPETMKEYKKILGLANAALSKAEILKKSLSKRYSILEEIDCREKNEKNNMITALHINAEENIKVSKSVPASDIKKSAGKQSISCYQLHSIMTSPQSSFIIMDARPAKDFAESHINHKHCISVPQELLKPHVTSSILESCLPKESLFHWFKRSEADSIVLVDWDSADENTNNEYLNTLKSAISRVDCGDVLRKTPVILKGGYKNWMLSFPAFTTHPVSVDSSKGAESSSISSTQLQALLTTTQSSFIIMDTRPAKDFADSHIKHESCINVPQEILTPGITAFTLQSLLPQDSRLLWSKRGDVDNIILLDWESKDETRNIHIKALKDAMCKWDQTCTLKKPPSVLKGGYKDWMMKYPTFTTQVIAIDSLSDVKSSSTLTDLSVIEYPSLDENENYEKGKNSTGMLFEKVPKPSDISNGTFPNNIALKKPSSAPLVDRSSKPSVDVNFKAPTVRKTSYSASSSKKEVSSSSNKVMPPVDRKAKSVLVSPKSDDKEALEDSLIKEQSLVNENLELTKKQLLSEKEMENLRLKKVLEAEESKLKEIQKQEEILIQKIQQLQLESETKNEEYLKTKEENVRMKKLLEETMDLEFKKRKEKEITDALNKQIALQKTVEKLREERKRKEAAELEKKKEIPKSTSRESVSANPTKRTSHVSQVNNSITNGSSYIIPLAKDEPDSSSRGLVRSHSSPNIAQMMNEEKNSQSKIPQVDRSLKPKSPPSANEVYRIQARNLNPVYGYTPGRPITGLKNLGNTCFMNSVIQCLSHTMPFSDFFNTGQYLDCINRNNKQGTDGELAQEFGIVIRSLWAGHYKSFSPKDFKNTVSQRLSVCIGNEQQDSHEFLVVLMEKLHADFNKNYVKTMPKLESTVNEVSFWKHHKKYNNSIISDTFEGLLKSTLTCLSCRKTSDSFEAFTCLSLPILSSKCSLRECFQHFLKPEKISGEAAWDCPRCKQKKEAEKRLHICKLPEILIIQLKRFSYEGLWRRKLQTHVEFDLSFEVPYEDNSDERFRSYSLYAVVNHYGTLEGGHYTAYCKNPNNKKWYRYDDHEVSEISVSDIKTSAAYLLFYSATNYHSNL